MLPLILAISCASAPTQEQMKSVAEKYTLPAKADGANAMIYVIRPSILAGLVGYDIYLDDTKGSSKIGSNKGKKFIYFSVTPGKHKIFSKADNTAEIEIVAEAGKEIFIKQNASVGVLMGITNLEIINEIEAKYYLKKGSFGMIVKTEK